jgi:hypothetical protein
VAAATTPTGFEALMSWLQQSPFLGLPNWILLGGAALLLSEGGHK